MNRTSKNSLVLLIIAAVVAGGGYGLFYAWQFATVAAAYKAQMLCAGVFVSKRQPQAVIAQDFSVKGLEPLRYVNAVVDTENRKVSTNVWSIVHRSAVYRPGLGCTLVYADLPHTPKRISQSQSQPNVFDTATKPYASQTGPETPLPSPLPKPLALLPQQDLNQVFDPPKLNAAVEWAFSEPDANNPRRTRAVVILYQGKIAAEKYAKSFDKDTPLVGWSMSKSVVNALVGILVKQGKLDINKPAPVAAWQDPGDPRSKITVNDLMHMVSGLQFEENYKDALSDVTLMLFDVADSAAYAANKNLLWPPASHWRYSSGSPEIVSRIIKTVTGAAYLDFPRQALFNPLGMRSALIEPDAAGTLLGSSFVYATPRDWARFGQLYLQDGVWEGQRILPQGWVAFATTPVPVSPRGEYGSYFWLKLPREFRSADDQYVVPQDAFHAAGYDGQLITVIPSRQLVIVRMGLTRYPVIWPQDEFVSKIVDAMK